jgi:hypothetical protein
MSLKVPVTRHIIGWRKLINKLYLTLWNGLNPLTESITKVVRLLKSLNKIIWKLKIFISLESP